MFQIMSDDIPLSGISIDPHKLGDRLYRPYRKD
jgi:hypothetical protein